MFSQLTTFLCGPFFYPVYCASFLHAYDFFVNFATPNFTRSEPRSHFPYASAFDSVLQPASNHKENK
jgi:hypothetical protein